MCEKMFKIRLHHPLRDTALELECPPSTTFGEIQEQLYKKGFMQKKPAGYGFVVDKRFCSLNKSLASYIPPETTDVVEITVSGLLTIMT